MTMQKISLIRTIYLYSFSLLGLVLMVIGSVKFLNMGLRAFIFTKADEQMVDYYMPPYPPCQVIEKIENTNDFSSEAYFLTVQDKEALKLWREDYQNWRKMPKINYAVQQRHRDASISLSLIVIGLPLYLYHWFIIRKELKNVN